MSTAQIMTSPKTLSIAGLLLLSSAASAAFVDVRFETIPGGPPGTVTCRAIARFSRGNDEIAAVVGQPGVPLEWITSADSGILNDNPTTAGSLFADMPLQEHGPYDSWVTIGVVGGPGPQVSFPPAWELCNPPAGQQLTDGCKGFANESTAYFAPNGPIPLSTLDPGGNVVDGWDAIIAQFTVSDNSVMIFRGSVSYRLMGNPLETEAFEADCYPGCPPDPCPTDVNGDGVVDILDLLELLSNWGRCR